MHHICKGEEDATSKEKGSHGLFVILQLALKHALRETYRTSQIIFPQVK